MLEHILKCGYVIHHFNVHVSIYFFLCVWMTYYLLTKWCLTKNKINFLTRSQNELWAGETTWNISDTLGPGAANTAQGWIKKSCKGHEGLEDEEHSGRPAEADHSQLGRSSRLMLLQLHKKFPKNSKWTFLWWFGTWNKLERWKGSVSGCLMSWLQTKTQFLNPVQQWRATKSGFYTTGDDQLSGWTEKLQSTSKAKLAPKEGPCHCLVVYCRPDPLQLSESWWNHSICEVRSANRWDAPKTAMPAAGTGQQRGPDSLHPTLAARSTEWSTFLPHPPHSPELSPTDYHFKHRDNFLQGNLFHNQQEAENAFQEFTESRSPDFYALGNKQSYFLLAKMCWLYWLLFWLMKMCLSLVIMI